MARLAAMPRALGAAARRMRQVLDGSPTAKPCWSKDHDR